MTITDHQFGIRCYLKLVGCEIYSGIFLLTTVSYAVLANTGTDSLSLFKSLNSFVSIFVFPCILIGLVRGILLPTKCGWLYFFICLSFLGFLSAIALTSIETPSFVYFLFSWLFDLPLWCSTKWPRADKFFSFFYNYSFVTRRCICVMVCYEGHVVGLLLFSLIYS